MKKKLVSVIVPVYNTEKQVERCISSITAQTYKELEIVVVEDGSTDSSLEICQRLAQTDSRIRVISKENGGVSSARNRGLEEAAGEYIAFVDSDDFIEPDTIEQMAEAAETYSAELVVGDYIRNSENEKDVKSETKVLSAEEVLWKYLSEDETIRIPHSVWGKLFARRLIGEKRFPLIKRTEELLFSTEIFCETNKCVYLPKAFYHYCDDREESLMHEADEKHTLETEIPLLLSQASMIERAGYAKAAEFAWFCLGKRLLYFYLTFRDKILGQAALQVKTYGRRNRKKILHSLKGENIKRTDRFRMAMFLFSPGLYYRFVLWHDRGER